MSKVTVIRIIKYEGTEKAVREAIQKSMPLGTKHLSDYDLSIVEHLNELPAEFSVEDQRIAELFMGIPVMHEKEVDELDGPFIQAMRERDALVPKPVGCCCPPKGYTGAWAAGPCPIHHGFRRLGN